MSGVPVLHLVRGKKELLPRDIPSNFFLNSQICDGVNSKPKKNVILVKRIKFLLFVNAKKKKKEKYYERNKKIKNISRRYLVYHNSCYLFKFY